MYYMYTCTCTWVNSVYQVETFALVCFALICMGDLNSTSSRLTGELVKVQKEDIGIGVSELHEKLLFLLHDTQYLVKF